MSVAAAARRTFSSLAVANYRRFFAGQAISLVGTWMQTTAQAWLVLGLTHSASDLGLVVALQSLPVLLLGAYGGVVADRLDKRRLMIALQSLMGLQALALGALTLTRAVRFPEICLLAVVLGLNNAFENPSRQAFVLEMVGRDDLRNAVSLNSTLMNATRTVGPALAGILIATVGVGWCFVLNAVSFVAVVASLASMDQHALSPSPPTLRERGQLREGLRYARHSPLLAVPLLMMALIGTLTFEFQVTLPVAAQRVFHGGAETYGLMTSLLGLGAAIGGLAVATRGRTGLRPIVLGAAGFGAAMAFAALAPSLPAELAALACAGFMSVAFSATGNSTVQLAAEPTKRGRIMALWSMAMVGSTPIGGPLVGWISGAAGARAGLGVGAAACVAAAAIGYGAMQRAARPRAGATRSTCPAPQVAASS
ncbi:MAG TPA: MFS transporter [Acidimicrobiales bacterium]|nr:MFS transporter [Acidimicrobiales bacterium]